MAQAEADLDEMAGKKPSRLKGLILGVFLALALGGGGFYAVWSGMILDDGQGAGHGAIETPRVAALPDIAFLRLDPILISLGSGGRVLRFQGQVEVDTAHAEDVEMLKPRIIDVLNSYLRAVEPAELEDPGALTRLRAQMLRRVQMVTGEGRVRDLLIMEFVFN
jgi:flagellar FliL protein